MALRIDRLRTDPEVELHGRWVNVMGGRLLIARAGNRRAREVAAALRAPYRDQIREADGGLPEELENEILARTMAQAILLGWEDVEGADGQPLPYSEEAAFEFLRDIPDFRRIVLLESARGSEAWRKAKEEDEQTLGNGSAGKSSGGRGSRRSGNSGAKA